MPRGRVHFSSTNRTVFLMTHYFWCVTGLQESQGRWCQICASGLFGSNAGALICHNGFFDWKTAHSHTAVTGANQISFEEMIYFMFLCIASPSHREPYCQLNFMEITSISWYQIYKTAYICHLIFFPSVTTEHWSLFLPKSNLASAIEFHPLSPFQEPLLIYWLYCLHLVMWLCLLNWISPMGSQG